MRIITQLLILLGISSVASAQNITAFKISNGWSSWHHAEYETIVYDDSNFCYHEIRNSTIEIDQPDNHCTILGYPLVSTYIPLDTYALDAIYFFDSLRSATQFEILITPDIKKSLDRLYNRYYHTDVDFTQYPFKISTDTIAVLSSAILPKTNEIFDIMDGIGASFKCTIIYNHKDTMEYGIAGNYDLSNSMYLDTTLPIFCFFQEYPKLFKEQNYFAPVMETNMGEIIFRFIRWQKQNEKAQKMDGTLRKNIQVGSEVEIVQKHHQRSGELTDGFVEKILTKSPNHPHGIKVKLETGEVGRVKVVIDEPLDDIEY